MQVEDSELADVAAVSAGNNYEIGNMIAEAMNKVGRQGVVTLEEGKSAENNLYVVEGMQFDRGYISPYFVTDSEKMSVEYENCKVCCTLSCQLFYLNFFNHHLHSFLALKLIFILLSSCFLWTRKLTTLETSSLFWRMLLRVDIQF
jgi:hypothetical protein